MVFRLYVVALTRFGFPLLYVWLLSLVWLYVALVYVWLVYMLGLGRVLCLGWIIGDLWVLDTTIGFLVAELLVCCLLWVSYLC